MKVQVDSNVRPPLALALCLTSCFLFLIALFTRDLNCTYIYTESQSPALSCLHCVKPYLGSGAPAKKDQFFVSSI